MRPPAQLRHDRLDLHVLRRLRDPLAAPDVPPRRAGHPARFDGVRKLCSVDKNWAALRAVVATETECIVPHLGVLLKDAIFVIDGNKTLEAGKTVSFLKCRMLSELIMRVNTMQLKLYRSFVQTVDEYEALGPLQFRKFTIPQLLVSIPYLLFDSRWFSTFGPSTSFEIREVSIHDSSPES